jgi:hypothetical protein
MRLTKWKFIITIGFGRIVKGTLAFGTRIKGGGVDKKVSVDDPKR